MLGQLRKKLYLQTFLTFHPLPASVVFLFFVSWTPFHFQRLGYVYFKSAEFFREVNQYLFYFSGKMPIVTVLLDHYCNATQISN